MVKKNLMLPAEIERAASILAAMERRSISNFVTVLIEKRWEEMVKAGLVVPGALSLAKPDDAEVSR